MSAKVTLLAYTPNPEQTVAMSAKLCYSKSDIETVRDGLTEEEARLRIHAQHDSSYYTEKADYLINGSAPLADVQSKIQDIISAVRQEETK